MSDQRTFEHDFFYWISNAFPNLEYLLVSNKLLQERKHSNDQLHFPKLIYLSIRYAHIDYINQFLHDKYTRITQSFILWIDYRRLVTATDNFTNDATRVNCSQVVSLNIDQSFVYPENFYLYFPLL